MFRPEQRPCCGEPLSGKRTKGIPFSGQDCSVPDRVLVVENLCQLSGQKGFRAPDWTFACPLSEEPLSGKRTKVLQFSGQDCSVPDNVLVMENLCKVSGQKGFRAPDRTVRSWTVSSWWQIYVR
jgi:hypothetical protein